MDFLNQIAELTMLAEKKLIIQGELIADVILSENINENLKSGMEYSEAVVKAWEQFHKNSKSLLTNC